MQHLAILSRIRGFAGQRPCVTCSNVALDVHKPFPHASAMKTSTRGRSLSLRHDFGSETLKKNTRSSRLSAIGRNLGFGWIWMHLALDGGRQKSSGTVIDFETLSAKVICRGAAILSYFDVTTAKTPFPDHLMPPPAYECASKSAFTVQTKFPDFAEKYHCHKRF